jgi:hypothetical protein
VQGCDEYGAPRVGYGAKCNWPMLTCDEPMQTCDCPMRICDGYGAISKLPVLTCNCFVLGCDRYGARCN